MVGLTCGMCLHWCSVGRPSEEMEKEMGPGISTYDDLRKELIHQLDISPDGRIDLWDVLALVLGRRKTPVELLLYDISNGVSKKFSGLLLGKRFEAIYHSAVLVFGSEYWYG